MSRFLYKLLLVLIGISFYISATEIDIGTSRNTFFDEHDTYVRSEAVSIDYGFIDHHLQHSTRLADGTSCISLRPVKHDKIQFTGFRVNSGQRQPELYLRNCVFII